jgi:hypothetical protein
MKTTAWDLPKNTGIWRRMVEPIFTSAVEGENGRHAMNRGYFDAILLSLIVAGCYMFIAPV